jgi:hypothetical protein
MRRDCLLGPQLAGMSREHRGSGIEQDHEGDEVGFKVDWRILADVNGARSWCVLCRDKCKGKDLLGL